MLKVVNIGGKDYSLKSSAYTQFAYKDATGRSLLADLKSVANLPKELDNLEMDRLDAVTELVSKMAYVMIKESNPSQVGDYIDFLKGIEDFYSDSSWILDVIQVGCAPISGRLQKNKK